MGKSEGKDIVRNAYMRSLLILNKGLAMKNTFEEILIKMKNASAYLANASTAVKNKALAKIAENLQKNSAEIFAGNKIDKDNAEKSKIAMPLLKRLNFDEKKLDSVIDGIRSLIKLEDPVNKIPAKTQLDKDLILKKVTVPIGLIGIIFESRPDALIQIATLCLKSGNCVILKGGMEALNTNRILAKIIYDSIIETDSVFTDTMHLIETREDVREILKYDRYINLIIPRGSNEFVKYIKDNSSIPVLGHADGICHVYVDKYADMDNAVAIAFDSKTQYAAVCNAMETLLVHKDIADKFLIKLKVELDKKNVIIKGDRATKEILKDIDDATEEDWRTEYLDYILSIKVVNDIDEAISHINHYGSAHTDSIVTENRENMNKFTSLVDSSSVMVNCSTRFSDGFIYGFGAEVGISTNKIHARGPVGLEGLVIYKYILEGSGNIVADYSEGKKKFKHKKLL